MTTVRQLIQQLEEIEDKDQAIIWQYYIAEHFEYNLDTGNVSPTLKEFESVAKKTESWTLWEDTAQDINDLLYDEIAKRENADSEPNK
jgi:elongation factor P hydroxylase